GRTQARSASKGNVPRWRVGLVSRPPASIRARSASKGNVPCWRCGLASLASEATVAKTLTADCPRCRRDREFFWYMGLYEYDVDRARDLVGDGREPVELEEDSVR